MLIMQLHAETITAYNVLLVIGKSSLPGAALIS